MSKGIYIRVSTQEQAAEEKMSIPNQQGDCTDLCERKGYSVFDLYTDAGHSSKSKNRPEYQRMIRDLRAGRIDGVIAWKWDRLGAGRGIYPLMDAIEEAGQSVTIETVHEGIISPLMLSMLTSFRAQVLKDQHDRLMAAGASRLKQGKTLGGYVRFGYDYHSETGTWTVNEEEAKWVRLIFEWYADEVLIKEIRRRLIKEKVPQKRGNNVRHPWHTEVIRTILKNSAYKGKSVVTWGGQAYEIPCPAIVSGALWQKAQDIMAGRDKWRSRNVRLPYMLLGMLRCADCGNIWKCRGIRYRYYKGERFELKRPLRYYECQTATRLKDCPHKKPIRAEILETAVWDAVKEGIQGGDVEEKIERRIAELRETRAERQAEADRLEDKFNRLQEERQWLILQARKGVITQADFEAQIEMLDTEGAELTLAYQEAAADIPDDLDELWWTAWEEIAREFSRLRSLNLDEKRQLLKTVVDEIVIDPEVGTLYLYGTLERVVQFSTMKL